MDIYGIVIDDACVGVNLRIRMWEYAKSLIPSFYDADYRRILEIRVTHCILSKTQKKIKQKRKCL